MDQEKRAYNVEKNNTGRIVEGTERQMDLEGKQWLLNSKVASRICVTHVILDKDKGSGQTDISSP